MTDIVQIQESEYDAILRQAVAVIDKTRAMVATTVCSAIGTAHWEIGKLLHDKLSRKKTYSNTVPMGRMLLTPSTSGVRSFHRRTYHLWLLILEESCNQKERHTLPLLWFNNNHPLSLLYRPILGHATCRTPSTRHVHQNMSYIFGELPFRSL